MKRTMRTVLLVLLLAVFPASVFADDAGSVTYDGENLVSDYNAIDVSDLQPGDSQTYTIKVQNDGDEETDWWLSNEVVQSLEDSTEASGGAYTYILQYNGEDIAYSAGSFSQRSAFNEKEKKAYFGVSNETENRIYIYDVTTGNVSLGSKLATGVYFDQIRFFEK